MLDARSRFPLGQGAAQPPCGPLRSGPSIGSPPHLCQNVLQRLLVLRLVLLPAGFAHPFGVFEVA
eukprot:4505661-Lingulodinium_polyedra.AAC.1